MPAPLNYAPPRLDPPGVVYAYFCPVTGRSLRLRNCRRDVDGLRSPHADVPVQFSGWAMLAGALVVCGAGLLYSGGLQSMHGNLGARELPAAGMLVFVCLALVRFGRQFRARRAYALPERDG